MVCCITLNAALAAKVAVFKDPALLANHVISRSDGIAGAFKGQEDLEAVLVGAIDAKALKPFDALIMDDFSDQHPNSRDLVDFAYPHPHGASTRASRLIDLFGLAILESSDFSRRRCAILTYTNCIGHRQQDALNLEL